ncbi:hypothetical protein QR680_002221 [Steinernema hermaphroditum]|uniref:Reverse transcriptase domain-containing protein n=1 Tax=Steinernema hermaphroditum TaxID=289476 RepID=A0AA39H2R9_9BILA|nr:hypothetical protein QR680_002221 [Steinernema hermaphroditum]
MRRPQSSQYSHELRGVPAAIINLLRKIYGQAASYVQLGEEQVPIKIQRGVRQGDTISPKLFTAMLEEVFRELDWQDFGININGTKLSNLRFADDIALIANTEEELQQMVSELDEASRRSGLRMNREKTKILATEEASIILNGEEIEQVEAFIYLGQETVQGFHDLQKRPDAKVKDIDEAARRRKWNFAWKMANGSPEKWYNRLEEWRPPVKRPLGRPRTRWSDDLTKKVGSRRWRHRAIQETRQRWIDLGCDNM